MKIKSAIVLVMLMALVISVASLFYLEDTIPIHFGPNGKPDQFGSKYFVLVFSGIIGALGGTMLLVVQLGKVTENYKKYLLRTCFLSELFFTAILIAFIYYARYYTQSDGFDISKVVMPLLGILFIAMGNYFPKIERNRTLGIRCKWTLHNETTWQKSHRFGGFVFVINGVLTLLCGIFFDAIVSFSVLVGLMTASITVICIAAYRIYKKERNGGR